MLEPSVYPRDKATPRKLRNLEEQFAREEYYRAPLTTFFKEGRNRTGIELQANTGSGQECTGLNDGSKNSVAVTYLADAWNWGAEVFCGCEVLRVESAGPDDGYIVHFVAHGLGREKFSKQFRVQPFWVKAKEFCFLGAGSIGTTEILLRSKANRMAMSPLVGKRMSGNGDLLLFGYNGRNDINGVSNERFDQQHAPGPVVTGVVDRRCSRSGGYVIQDGIIPEPFSPFIQYMLIMQTFMHRVFSWDPWRLLAAIKSLVFGAYVQGGAIVRTATYLVMSHDSGEVSMSLEKDRPVLKGPRGGRSKRRGQLKEEFGHTMKASGAKMGFSYFYGKHFEEVTVHPLGGAVMSCDGSGREGVVNHLGEVFSGRGSDVYPRLVCCDASVVPASLSVNPLATITALAERDLHLLSNKYDFDIDYDTRNSNMDKTSLPMRGRPQTRSNHADLQPIDWQFTEMLEGTVTGFSTVSNDARNRKRRTYGLQAFLTVDLLRTVKRKCSSLVPA
jgi:hypothetical protein